MLKVSEFFKRSDSSYCIKDETIVSMLKDPASPVGLVCQLLPTGAKVLDVGAGSGVLARALQLSRKKVYLDGIEPNTYAADLARKFYDNFYVGFAADCIEQTSAVDYDYIVLLDVVEHTVDSDVFLRDLCDAVGERVKFIISMPNVAFGAVRLSLLHGHFRYVDSGLLEKTHLRFFTKEMCLSLFQAVGLKVKTIHQMQRSFYRTEIKRVEQSRALLQVLRLSYNRTARSYQYVFELESVASNVTTVGPLEEEVNMFDHGVSGFVVLMDWLLGPLYDYLSTHGLLKRFFDGLKGLLLGRG